MSERLLGWLTKRRELNVVKMVQNHLFLSTGCVEELAAATKKMMAGNRNDAMPNILRLNDMEKEADSLRRTIMDELVKGEFSPAERDDLMHLVKRVDMVADYSRSSGRNLQLISIDKYPDKMKDTITLFIEKTLDNSNTLNKSVTSLTSNTNDVMKYGDIVERIEEEVDEIYATARGVLKDLPATTMTPGEFILLSDYLNALENINDSCEDTVDQLRLIIVKLK